MNRIYKVVWNAARSCYVVGSEFIHSNHTEGGCGREQKRAGCTLKRAVLAALLAGTVLLPLSGAQVSAYSLAEIANETAQWGAIDDLKDNQQDVSDLKTQVGEQGEAIDQLKTNDEAQSEAIESLQKGQENVSNLKGQVDEHEAAIKEHETEIGDLQTSVTQQGADIGTLKDDVTGLQVSDEKQNNQIEALQTSVTQQGADIGTLKDDVTGLQVSDEKQNNQIEDLQTSVTQQGADIGTLKDDVTGLQVSDEKQNGQINGLEHENDKQWGAINGGIVHDAIQDSAIVGGMIKDEHQDAAIDHNYEIDKEQGKDIAGLEHENDKQWGAINGGVVHDAIQDGAIVGGMIKDDHQDEAIKDLAHENDKQWGAINGGVVHDAIQDSAIVGGMIKDEQQDDRLDAVEDKNKTQDDRLDGIDDKNKTQDDRLDGIDDKNKTQDDRLDGIDDKNKTQDDRLNGIDDKNKIQDDRLDGIDDKNKIQDDRLDGIDNRNDQQDVAIKNAHESVSVGNGLDLSVKENANEYGGTNYEVSLKDDFTVGNADGNHVTVTGTEGNIEATGTITAGNVTLNKDGEGTVSGLTNTKWDPENNHYDGSSLAATESQLQQAIDQTAEELTDNSVQYDKHADGTVNKGSVTLGDGQTPTGLHNVAAGEVTATSTDAVNGSQLWGVQQQVNSNTSAISGLNSRVDTLDGRIDKVGANAAALAALHPLDFDPDDKWDFAAGVGNYGGENAMAVGAFYRPNEDTMFSVGGSFGTGENMVNAGVSFKIGQGNHVSTSRVAMAKEIETLRHNVAQLTELVNKLVGSQDQIQNAMTTPFPDVPENHWAYETIEQMRERGIVEGYPDGTFGGDRQMTRYEFATIVYRALQKGLGMNEELQRLVDEFRPELELIRVDTIAQDSEGNPTIERVRVNKA